MILPLADTIILFTLYSLAGWILETIYASVNQRAFVNRGFLFGPFCPIYGIGALLMIMIHSWLVQVIVDPRWLVAADLLLAIVFITVLEYLVGYILEQIFDCRWWEYDDEAFNLHGRVCLKYSLLWGFLAFALLRILQPANNEFLALMPDSAKYVIMISLIFYIVFDTAQSVSEALDLNALVLSYYMNPIEKSYEKLLAYQRILKAFPELYFVKLNGFNQVLRSSVNEKMGRLQEQLKGKRAPY